MMYERFEITYQKEGAVFPMLNVKHQCQVVYKANRAAKNALYAFIMKCSIIGIKIIQVFLITF